MDAQIGSDGSEKSKILLFLLSLKYPVERDALGAGASLGSNQILTDVSEAISVVTL